MTDDKTEQNPKRPTKFIWPKDWSSEEIFNAIMDDAGMPERKIPAPKTRLHKTQPESHPESHPE
jgi:hypothetical protein